MVRMPHWPMPSWQDLPGDSPERMARVLKKLGNPHLKLPPVIHVAGTNGKGSTIAFLRAMLKAAGYRVHAYVSPHIRDFNERILLDNTPIDEGMLHEVMEATRLANNNEPISFFEGTTAGAFLAFSKVPADVVIIETGMGGRFDPTNMVPNPVLTIITSIYYDHMEYLGRTLPEITWHKAGIMKKGVACVISHQLPEVMEALRQEAEKMDVPLYIFGKHWAVRRQENGLLFIDANGEVEFPPPKLLGGHQYINAATAIAAITTLENFNVPGEAVAEGLRRVQWSGRLERIEGGNIARLLPPEWELWFDGGHNASCAMAIGQWIEDEWHDKPTYMIFGTTEGKELEGLFGPLKGKVERLCAVRVDSEPNSYDAAAIESVALKAGIPAGAFTDVEQAVHACIADSRKPARVLAFGSFYLKLLLA